MLVDTGQSIPVGLTERGLCCLSNTTSEHVASKPIPCTVDLSMPSVTDFNNKPHISNLTNLYVDLLYKKIISVRVP